ncbi:MAG: ATP-binding protein [Candidatus Atribacteria bacterium]|nr:MAG: ATP-binding protein [Candidatus Atribacteria bacterium]
MIQRSLTEKLLHLSAKFPVVSLTGPRQSGKTTLLKMAFPNHKYASLEDPDTRIFAETDPRSFLNSGSKMIVDEIQRLPELFSYIQSITDESGIDGQFIISGSQSFLLNDKISQSLAGRVAVLNLLPLSISEIQNHGFEITTYEELLYKGFYPRLYDKNIEPEDFYPNYVQTYIERDVRLLQNIQDLNQFVRFVKLCAGRIGQLLNLSSLAHDAGLSVNTAKAWLSVLEASFIVFLLHPYHRNFNKRLVKMPKLYFYDPGLASSLLEIHSVNQISTHYLTGPLFENLILAELLKNRYHQGLRSNIFFWRDHRGSEIDCIIEDDKEIIPIEIKSSRTFSPEFFNGISYWGKISGSVSNSRYVVYGGDESAETQYGKLVSWRNLTAISTGV